MHDYGRVGNTLHVPDFKPSDFLTQVQNNWIFIRNHQIWSPLPWKRDLRKMLKGAKVAPGGFGFYTFDRYKIRQNLAVNKKVDFFALAAGLVHGPFHLAHV